MARNDFLPDLVNVLGFTPFEVYGLAGPVFGLRLHHFTYTVDAEAQRVTGVHLYYVAPGSPAKTLGLLHAHMPTELPYADLAFDAEWANAELYGLCETLHALRGDAFPALSDALIAALLWVEFSPSHANPALAHLQLATLGSSPAICLARQFHGPHVFLAGGAGLTRREFAAALRQTDALKSAPAVVERHEQEFAARLHLQEIP